MRAQPVALPLLLDQGVPHVPQALLDRYGIDARHVFDLGMAEAPDEEILAYAANRDLVIVTLDSDFHQMLAVQGLDSPSVIRFRIQGLTYRPMVRLLALAIERFEAGAPRGGGGVRDGI